MTGRIYCISNTVNDKVYIGKTTHSIEKRFQEHCHDSKKSRVEKRPLYDAMNKHGVENFQITLVEEVDLYRLSEREEYWIKHFNSYHNGYNATRGGDGKILYNYELFVEDYKNGMTICNIAKKHNCSEDTVSVAIHTAGFSGKENQISTFGQKVWQFDKAGNLIQVFNSITDAARSLVSTGCKSSEHSIRVNISRVVNGERKSSRGFVWRASEAFSL